MSTTSIGPVKRGMRDYTFNMDGVNEQDIVADGDYFHVQAVSVGGVNVFLRFDDGPAITRSQGQGNRVYYSRIAVSTSAACQVTIQAGYGYATDSRASVNANITTPISPALHNPAVADVPCPTLATTLLLAADPNRLGCVVGIDSSQANLLRIGDGTTGAGAGIKVEPGQTLPIFSQDALYAYNPGAGTITPTITKFMKT